MDEKLGFLPIRILAQGGEGHILLSDQGIWVPRPRPSSTEGVPDLLGMLIGPPLDARRWSEPLPRGVDIAGLLEDTNDPGEVERRLMRHATQIPYSSILRCYLAHARRFSVPKLAFECFDTRLRRVVSREFRVIPGDVEGLERFLRGKISERMEVH